MDKVIWAIQGANGLLTCGQNVLSKLDFRPNNSGGREKAKNKGKRERRRKLRERRSTFSLGFPAIRPTVSNGARRKVFPRAKSFKLRPETRSYDKLQEVGLLLLWLFSTLRVCGCVLPQGGCLVVF